METFEYRSQLKYKESIQKLKDYLKSLFFKKHEKDTKKISDATKDQLTAVISDENINEEKNSTNWGTNTSDLEKSWTWESSTEDTQGNSQKGNWEWGQQNRNNGNNEKKWEFEIPPEDQDEYIPTDSEFGEAMWEQSRFAEIYPPFLGYYSKWKKSYFNRETNLWSKRKILTSLTHKLPEWIKKYTYTWVITKWINAIPLPDLAWPDTSTLHSTWKSAPEFQIDQNGCVYLVSKEKQFVSFNFWLNQHEDSTAPISADSEKIVFDSLSKDTQELLTNLKSSGVSPQQIAAAIKYYIIKNKKYSTRVQWTLRNKSNRNNYIKHLDESPILECFSANSLFVALCRELWVPARLVVWHMVQSTNKEWKACLTKNDGHAWSEIWDTSVGWWIRVDSTPTEKENWEDSNENWQEQNDNQNNNENADNNFWDNNQSNENKWDKNKNWTNNEKNDSQSDSKWDKSDNKNSNNSDESDSETSESKSDSQSDNTSDSDSKSQSDNESTQRKHWEDTESNLKSSGKWKLLDASDDKPNKTPSELLDEMVEKAKEDDLMKQSEELKNVLDKLDNAESREDIKKILDESKLSDFAKDMVDKIWKDKILDDEKKELEKVDDENKIDELLKDSLLDDEYKKKLKEYAKMMKDKIAEEKRKMRSEMERLWFNENEVTYFKEYKQLEAEVEPEVRKQIRELQKILPVNYQILTNEKDIYRSWPKIDWSKLADFVATWDPLIFRRNHEVRESNEINMFETIIIDTSWSMWNINYPWSILRESVKAAIIRAKVLEHFKVDFSIVLFWDRVDEVMSFGEKFSSKKKCSIPARLMRSAHKSGGNSKEPISYVYQNMLKQYKKNRWKSFWNISFIWDGDLYSWMQRSDLKAMIDDLKNRWFGVTAYYINDTRSRLIDYYFGSEADGWAVYAWSSKELSKEIVEAHKTHLKKKIKKYMK